ncbi:hypothetical protein B1772_06450 [Dehalococcoides mccartyi]|jgi:hypothetical protein|uniref:DUF2007 domain-containing protein n=1 Tax=Dehalococcoides mccartyi TaxID=61435 RepID=A0A328EKI6_9CHLR|nr:MULTISPECIES: DUF2007 domain-containing protein [Dehalococcoides]AGG06913.1 hypothetical protein dcmb_1320 [Dehalococcoides mccartyi DCMB5]AQX75118.1 hypothetical protein B1776_06140 [Dehalococcoides mccartyi]AQY73694.1 hypothetical protein B1772_06450 [Dehalococcoides mccartyi]RAL69047.1 hypothetical protein C1G87_1320 [Dehalococcoides mccartyi]RAL70409.1 hypothetical protein C1G86_1349 [Dehalococcoides mccartyi]
MPQADKLELAGIAPNQIVAEMWQGFLEGEGIPSTLGAQHVFSYLGVTMLPVSLYVLKEHLTQAKEILADLQIQNEEPDESAE